MQLMVSGTTGRGGPNVRAIMVIAGEARYKHEPVHHPGQLTTVKHVEGQQNAQPHVYRLLNAQVSKIQYKHKRAWSKSIAVMDMCCRVCSLIIQ